MAKKKRQKIATNKRKAPQSDFSDYSDDSATSDTDDQAEEPLSQSLVTLKRVRVRKKKNNRKRKPEPEPSDDDSTDSDPSDYVDQDDDEPINESTQDNLEQNYQARFVEIMADAQETQSNEKRYRWTTDTLHYLDDRFDRDDLDATERAWLPANRDNVQAIVNGNDAKWDNISTFYNDQVATNKLGNDKSSQETIVTKSLSQLLDWHQLRSAPVTESIHYHHVAKDNKHLEESDDKHSLLIDFEMHRRHYVPMNVIRYAAERVSEIQYRANTLFSLFCLRWIEKYPHNPCPEFIMETTFFNWLPTFVSNIGGKFVKPHERKPKTSKMGVESKEDDLKELQQESDEKQQVLNELLKVFEEDYEPQLGVYAAQHLPDREFLTKMLADETVKRLTHFKNMIWMNYLPRQAKVVRKQVALLIDNRFAQLHQYDNASAMKVVYKFCTQYITNRLNRLQYEQEENENPSERFINRMSKLSLKKRAPAPFNLGQFWSQHLQPALQQVVEEHLRHLYLNDDMRNKAPAWINKKYVEKHAHQFLHYFAYLWSFYAVENAKVQQQVEERKQNQLNNNNNVNKSNKNNNANKKKDKKKGFKFEKWKLFSIVPQVDLKIKFVELGPLAVLDMVNLSGSSRFHEYCKVQLIQLQKQVLWDDLNDEEFYERNDIKHQRLANQPRARWHKCKGLMPKKPPDHNPDSRDRKARSGKTHQLLKRVLEMNETEFAQWSTINWVEKPGRLKSTTPSAWYSKDPSTHFRNFFPNLDRLHMSGRTRYTWRISTDGKQARLHLITKPVITNKQKQDSTSNLNDSMIDIHDDNTMADIEEIQTTHDDTMIDIVEVKTNDNQSRQTMQNDNKSTMTEHLVKKKAIDANLLSAKAVQDVLDELDENKRKMQYGTKPEKKKACQERPRLQEQLSELVLEWFRQGKIIIPVDPGHKTLMAAVRHLIRVQNVQESKQDVEMIQDDDDQSGTDTKLGKHGRRTRARKQREAEANQTTFTLGNKEYYHLSGYTEAALKRRYWRTEAGLNAMDIYLSQHATTCSARTMHSNVYKSFLKYISADKLWTSLWFEQTQMKYRKLRFNVHKKGQQIGSILAKMLCQGDDPNRPLSDCIILWSGGSFGPTSKGHASAPNKKLREQLALAGVAIVVVSEYLTSQRTACCHHQSMYGRDYLWKPETKTAPNGQKYTMKYPSDEKYKLHGLLYCYCNPVKRSCIANNAKSKHCFNDEESKQEPNNHKSKSSPKSKSKLMCAFKTKCTCYKINHNSHQVKSNSLCQCVDVPYSHHRVHDARYSQVSSMISGPSSVSLTHSITSSARSSKPKPMITSRPWKRDICSALNIYYRFMEYVFTGDSICFSRGPSTATTQADDELEQALYDSDDDDATDSDSDNDGPQDNN